MAERIILAYGTFDEQISPPIFLHQGSQQGLNWLIKNSFVLKNKVATILFAALKLALMSLWPYLT